MTTDIHIHHWVIESPDGKYSTGICKHCGMRRQFHNYTDTNLITHVEREFGF